MRERITLVHSPDTGIEPEALGLDISGLHAPPVEAVREDRLTLAIDGLPLEVAQVLQNFRELHLRWSSPRAYKTLDPFASRLSPGFHVSYTPSSDSTSLPSRLCSSLQAFGPLDCMSPEAFTEIKDQHSSGKPTLYFYGPLEDLNVFSNVLRGVLCRGDETCKTRAIELESAVALDFDFDSETEVSKLAALWPLKEQKVDIDASETVRTEVGVLAQGSPPNMGTHDIGVGGILAVLGERKKPSPTLFAFPSRHRLSGMGFSSRFLLPTGLHPTLEMTLSHNQPPERDADCRPYAYLTLPKTIFADRYQLDDALFMASKNLTAARNTSLPVDLEAPAYTTRVWGSSVLIEMAPPSAGETQEWTAQVPLHLRYLEPSATGERAIEVPYPAVFWACQADRTIDFTNNPFDRRNLGYDSLFDSNTVFWHVEPRPSEGETIINSITVPVLRQEATSWVSLGTAGVIALGFAWVMWKVVGAYMKHGHGASPHDDGKATTEKKTR